MLSATDFSGRTVVVTAGGTREPIDPVRFLGNRSSGKMGNALAEAAHAAGATVFLISAAPPPPEPGVHFIHVDTAAEMHAAVRDALVPGAVLIMAAAVADYRPAETATSKLKKSPGGMTLRLVPTVDILASLAADPMRESLFVVGFAAETNDVLVNGRAKVVAKRLDLCVINDVSIPGIGMGTDDNAVTVLDRNGVVAEVAKAAKRVVAERILALVAERVATAPPP